MRHSAAHLMAAAVMELYPQTKFGIGPTTENGFYYDFELPVKLTDADLSKIEERIRILQGKKIPFIHEEMAMSVAIEKAKAEKQEYKLELLEDLSATEKEVKYYKTGAFEDLCKGPHVADTSETGVIKLLSLAGAYWKGNEKNKMLTRIYGTAFPTQKELDAHLTLLSEAKKRDHRILGPQLDLFVINQDIGKGLPLLTPKGAIIRNQIIAYERELEEAAGFSEVWTPHIAKNDIYKRTGHWEHYRDVMYAPFGIDNETYVLKPMNCPHHYMIYASRARSYRDLPIRLSEPGTCYRYEKSGELGGLTRVRALSIDDSHILMREDQIEQEFATCIAMVKKMYEAFGLKEYWVRLSLNDPSDSVKYIADTKTWKKAGEKLEKIIKDNDLRYEVGKGEASFYGPKIDFMVKDAIGRPWQMSTLQLDLFMAKRLGLTYIDENGKEANPVILHRGLTGSLERTIGILIEHFAGAFPTWLNPVQVRILPITDRHVEYAKTVFQKLKNEHIRVELDDRSETLGAKIRKGQEEKVSYMLIIGDKEVETMTVAERARSGKAYGPFSIETFLENLIPEIKNRVLT